jgi:7,8-dihydro-6-hydroxymethylpterin-pyrophosphokinase
LNDPEGRKYTMAQPQFQVDRTTALYERPAMDIVDATTFAEVKQVVEAAFAPASVDKFLTSVERSGMRIRDFEKVVKAGQVVEWRPRADTRVLPGVGGEGRA